VPGSIPTLADTASGVKGSSSSGITCQPPSVIASSTSDFQAPSFQSVRSIAASRKASLPGLTK
jgi:hypothetical protein